MLAEGCAYSGFAGITRRSVLPIASGESCPTGVARDAGPVLPAPAPAPAPAIVPEGSSSSSGTQRLLPEPPGPRVGCRLPTTSLSRTPRCRARFRRGGYRRRACCRCGAAGGAGAGLTSSSRPTAFPAQLPAARQRPDRLRLSEQLTCPSLITSVTPRVPPVIKITSRPD